MSKNKKLSLFEWTLIFGSMRYFMGRRTISSALYPWDLIKTYFDRLTSCQKEMLVKDLRDYLEDHKIFGNEMIDHSVWLKFMHLLDEKSYIKYKEKNKKKIKIGFIINNLLYDVNKLKSSFQNFHYLGGIDINNKKIEIIK